MRQTNTLEHDLLQGVPPAQNGPFPVHLCQKLWADISITAAAMPSAQALLLSPAELAYLHTSLSLPTPIRPDGRKPTQFRPLTAETGILPGTNGSARVCFADGTEAIVGVKAEIEKSIVDQTYESSAKQEGGDARSGAAEPAARNEWLEITVEIPGYRDDDATTVFLASMLSEALVADGEFAKKLVINRRFHWKLYLDVGHPPFVIRLTSL